MKPLDEAVAQRAAIMDAAISEGVPDFVLNARTDAFVLGRDRDQADVLADAVERGKAYLDAGAPTVFVPGLLDEDADHHPGRRLRAAAAHRDRLPRAARRCDRLEELGVARVSYGHARQPARRVALTRRRSRPGRLTRGRRQLARRRTRPEKLASGGCG